MDKIKKAADKIRNLSPEELARFRSWFLEFDSNPVGRSEAQNKRHKRIGFLKAPINIPDDFDEMGREQITRDWQ